MFLYKQICFTILVFVKKCEPNLEIIILNLSHIFNAKKVFEQNHTIKKPYFFDIDKKN